MKQLEPGMGDFETARWLKSLGFNERTMYRYATDSFEICEGVKIRQCRIGELVRHNECVMSSDFLNNAIAAPTLLRAAEFIHKKSGIKCNSVPDERNRKFYYQAVAYGSIIVMETVVCITDDDALETLMKMKNFRKCVENEISKKEVL